MHHSTTSQQPHLHRSTIDTIGNRRILLLRMKVRLSLVRHQRRLNLLRRHSRIPKRRITSTSHPRLTIHRRLLRHPMHNSNPIRHQKRDLVRSRRISLISTRLHNTLIRHIRNLIMTRVTSPRLQLSRRLITHSTKLTGPLPRLPLIRMHNNNISIPMTNTRHKHRNNSHLFQQNLGSTRPSHKSLSTIIRNR